MIIEAKGENPTTLLASSKKDLGMAARSGNEQEVSEIVAAGSMGKLEKVDAEGLSPLAWAARCGHYGVVRVLLLSHADVNPRHGGLPALFAAAREGHEGLVTLLLDRRAELGTVYGAEHHTALHHVCQGKQTRALKLLLTRRADPNQLSLSGVSSLMAAGTSGHQDAIRELLDHRADPNLTAENGTTALANALRAQHPNAARVLLESGARADAWAVYYAVESSDPGLMKLALGDGDCIATATESVAGMGPLHLAADQGSLGAAEGLVNLKASLEATDVTGSTPLMLAAQGGHDRVAALLLRHKAAVDARDEQGNTAIHFAGMYEKEKVFRVLVEAGAAPFALNRAGRRPRTPDIPECHPQ